LCLLPDTPSVQPSVNQTTSMRTLAGTCAVNLQGSSYVAVSKLQLWYRQLAAVDERPSCAVDAFVLCSGDILPCTKKLLQIMATLPVTSCSSGRSYSTLRRLRTYLRMQYHGNGTFKWSGTAKHS
jgi:hypothetical protein